jgi:tetratricopeptide (TPR) repeat protein
VRRGEGLWLRSTDWTLSVLYLGLGRYEEALVAAERAIEQPSEIGLSTWAAPELIEAAARSGNPERAAGALARLSEICRACDTDWALGLEARSRALLSEGEEAERLHREAIARLGRTCVRVALARAHLLYGEWLRRASSCGSPTTSLSRWAPRRSPTARAASCWPPARPSAAARPRPSTS